MPSLIGSRITRLEHAALLRGRGRFLDDIAVPDVLHAAFVRSPHAHAAIRGISTAAALDLPGVHAVLTLDDLAAVMAKRRMLRHSNSGTPLERLWSFALADGEVSYVGETVAIVVGDNRYVAEDAVALVEVEYDVLPAVADCRKATAPDAPTVRRELNTNIIASYKVAFGNAEAAFGKAAHVFHEELWQHRGAGHSIEGRGILAEYRGTDDAISQHSVDRQVAVTVFISKSSQGRPEGTATIRTMTFCTALTEYVTTGFLILAAGIWIREGCIHALACGNHASQTKTAL